MKDGRRDGRDSFGAPARRLGLLQVALPSFLLVANLVLFGTLAVYSTNPGEFQISYWQAVSVVLPASLFAVAALSGLVIALPRRVAEVVLGVLIGLGFLTYVQGSFLLWNYGLLDGSGLDLSAALPAFVDGALWVGTAALVLRYRRVLVERAIAISAAVLVIQIVGAAAFALRADAEGAAESRTSPALPESLTRLSSGRNVFHIVLDAFQADVLQELLDEEPELANPLSGFTFFADATASSNVTYLSVAASLTGDVFRSERAISQYKRETLGGTNLYSVLSANGFQVDLAVPTAWYRPADFLGSHYRIPAPYTTAARHRRSTALRLLDLSLFRQVPHSAKPWVYNSESWRLSRDSGLQFEHHSHLAFLKDLTGQLVLGGTGAVYKWLHVVSPHGPLVTSADCSFSGAVIDYTRANFVNQSRCTLLGVSGFLDRLEELGVYDSSLILIHGDHGGSVPFRLRNAAGEAIESTELGLRYPGAPVPLVLVKPVGATGPLRTSERPVQLLDVAATVIDQLGLDHAFPGLSMFDGGPRSLERHYYSSRAFRHDAVVKDYFDEVVVYTSRGSVYDETAWTRGATVVNSFRERVVDSAYRWNSTIEFGREGNSRPYQGTGWARPTQSSTSSSLERSLLTINFAPTARAIELVATVRAHLPKGVPGIQNVLVSVGGREAGRWKISRRGFHQESMLIPADHLVSDGPTEIEFRFPDAVRTVRPGERVHGRMEAMAFRSIAFRETG